MPSTYTSRLRFTLPATGELTNVWGNTVNNGITELVESSIAGAATLSTWGGAGVAYTLSNNNGVADEARCMFLVASGTPGENKNIICPAVTKLYVVRNNVSGGFSVTLKTSAGTGITVPNGTTMFLRCDGTDVVDALTRVGNFQAATLGVSGTTTLSGLTASTALALNGSKEVVSVTNTGTGNNVLATSPTLTTPVLGAATATSINGLTISTTTGTLTLANGSTLATSGANSLTLTTTGATNVTFPTSGTLATTGGTVASFSAGTTGFTPSTATTGAVTLAGTLATTNGGTGLTSFTANQVFYASSASAVGQSANLTFNGTTLTANALTVSTGNLTFSGTAQRITGDFSNATVANRLMFQTSSADSSTSVNAIPNGTATNSNVRAVNNSSPTNAAFTAISVSNAESQIVAGIYGTGTYLPMTFFTGGSERVRIDTSGNVGIGTASPVTTSARLSVIANGDFDAGIAIGSNASASNWARLDFKNTNAASPTILYQDPSGLFGMRTDGAYPIAFYTNGGNERMRIDSSGNVGIGTASPGVNGLDVGRSAGTAVIRSLQADTGAGTFAQLLAQKASGAAGEVIVDQTSVYIGSTTNSPVVFRTNVTERMRIDASGNVGIGTASPGFRLDVSGSGHFTGGVTFDNSITLNTATLNYLYFADALSFTRSGVGERMRIDASGNVGIGVSPSYKLDVYGGVLGTTLNSQIIAQRLTVASSNADHLEISKFRDSAGTGWETSGWRLQEKVDSTWMGWMQFNGFGNQGGIAFGAGTTTVGPGSVAERMRIDSSGNVGIGTASPSGNLQVSAANTRVRFSNTAGTASTLLFGADSGSTFLGAETNAPVYFITNNTEQLRILSTGGITSANLADAVGYKGTPLNEQSTAYTLVIGDQGKSIVHPISDNNARTFTIPANGSVAYPVGTAITFINMINTLTISINTDTMYLAGAGTTGSRTLAAYGMATAVKLTSTTWIISGNGLT